MKILILGGTRFVGRALIEAASARQHEITLFNRGKTNPHLYPQIEKLIGDRHTGDLHALQNRAWDVVIDTCGYHAAHVLASAETLHPNVPRYIFISSISAYGDIQTQNLDESAAVEYHNSYEIDDSPATYGPRKGSCEKAVQAVYGEKGLIIRPGLIVGPNDQSDRFTYWPSRLADGGEVLAPGTPDAPVQVIDVRDLALWTIKVAEKQKSGIYNAVGVQEPLTMGQILAECHAVANSDATLTWVDDAFLTQHSVAAYTEMPLWVPAESAAFNTVSNQKAKADGLSFRPIAETILDTLNWKNTRSAEYEWRAGLSREREKSLLSSWHQRPTQ